MPLITYIRIFICQSSDEKVSDHSEVSAANNLDFLLFKINQDMWNIFLPFQSLGVSIESFIVKLCSEVSSENSKTIPFLALLPCMWNCVARSVSVWISDSVVTSESNGRRRWQWFFLCFFLIVYVFSFFLFYLKVHNSQYFCAHRN